MKRAEVQEVLIAARGMKSWEEFRKDFDLYASDRKLRSSVSAAGVPKPGKALFSDQHNAVSVDGDWLCFTVQADSGANPHGSFFFYKNAKFGASKSQLFDEQFQGSVPFEGYRYGVRVDQNEAGVYDYAANALVGKFILGISGSEGYYDTTSNVVTVRFRKSLLGKQLPATGDITAVSY